MKIRNSLLSLIIIFLFNGCIFSIGASQGMCESEECDYRESGVCAGVIDIYTNRDSLQNYSE